MDRKELALRLEEHLRNVNVYFDREHEFPKGRGPLKTYIVEAHAANGESLGPGGASSVLFDAADSHKLRVQETKDKNLLEVSGGDVGFFFDLLDPRFWIVHTMSNIDVAEEALGTLIEDNPHLDFAWPPSDLMRDIQRTGRPMGFAVDFDETALLPSREDRFEDEPNAVVKIRHGGTGAEVWLRKLEEFASNVLAFSMVKFSREDQSTGAYIIQELNERGRLKAAGNSINLHLQVVSMVLHEYKSLILAIEDHARVRPGIIGTGKTILGEPLVFDFPSPLRDFNAFVRELVSCREPLRMWGIVDEIGSDRVQIEGVDLHTGSRLRFDVTPNYMRIYLGPRACGNTVARLLRNLQAHINSTIHVQLPAREAVA
jgi:hypothetical protein